MTGWQLILPIRICIAELQALFADDHSEYVKQ
jgi:hypothetical protein